MLFPVTGFLLVLRVPGADYRVHILTPHRELPFAGHPTLGSCHVWLASGGKARRHEVIQECEIGLIRIRRDAGRFSFAAPELIRRSTLEVGILARVIEGLRLSPDTVLADHWVDNGPRWLTLLLRTRANVLAL